jgi:molybdate transport system ATP-binding protein
VLPFAARPPRELSIPIVYVSHALDEIVKLAETLLLMARRKTLAAGPVQEIVDRFRLAPR